jgi:lysophospholipase L1-like esterase
VTVRTFVAVGDSFTEGLEDDPGPDGRHRGWADRVAAGLAVAQGRVRYANLAVRGKLLDQVVAEQLPVARRLAPDLVSFQAGANDVLRPRTDLPALLRRYEDALAGLPARTLLFTVVERTGPGRAADVLAARFRAFNAGIRAIAARQDALLVDLAAETQLADRRLFHADRLHLAPEGHARVAAAVLETLDVADPAITGGPPGWWRVIVPGDPRTSRRADLVADVRWVRHHLLPWIGRRVRGISSGDHVPAKHAALIDVLAPDPI